MLLINDICKNQLNQKQQDVTLQNNQQLKINLKQEEFLVNIIVIIIDMH
jgi:hypothetical protein